MWEQSRSPRREARMARLRVVERHLNPRLGRRRTARPQLFSRTLIARADEQSNRSHPRRQSDESLSSSKGDRENAARLAWGRATVLKGRRSGQCALCRSEVLRCCVQGRPVRVVDQSRAGRLGANARTNWTTLDLSTGKLPTHRWRRALGKPAAVIEPLIVALIRDPTFRTRKDELE